MAAHLTNGRVNLNILREAARKELREFLDKCAGSKVIHMFVRSFVSDNHDQHAMPCMEHCASSYPESDVMGLI